MWRPLVTSPRCAACTGQCRPARMAAQTRAFLLPDHARVQGTHGGWEGTPACGAGPSLPDFLLGTPQLRGDDGPRLGRLCPRLRPWAIFHLVFLSEITFVLAPRRAGKKATWPLSSLLAQHLHSLPLRHRCPGPGRAVGRAGLRRSTGGPGSPRSTTSLACSQGTPHCLLGGVQSRSLQWRAGPTPTQTSFNFALGPSNAGGLTASQAARFSPGHFHVIKCFCR